MAGLRILALAVIAAVGVRAAPRAQQLPFEPVATFSILEVDDSPEPLRELRRLVERANRQRRR